jgi:hypothetical protein
MERLYIYVCTYDQRQKDRHQQHLWLRAWATNRAVYGLSKKQVSFKFTTKMFLYTLTITTLNQVKLFAKFWNQNTMETVEITIAEIPGRNVYNVGRTQVTSLLEVVH